MFRELFALRTWKRVLSLILIYSQFPLLSPQFPLLSVGFNVIFYSLFLLLLLRFIQLVDVVVQSFE